MGLVVNAPQPALLSMVFAYSDSETCFCASGTCADLSMFANEMQNSLRSFT